VPASGIQAMKANSSRKKKMSQSMLHGSPSAARSRRIRGGVVAESCRKPHLNPLIRIVRKWPFLLVTKHP
jgi:hypothetical protein